MAKNKTAETSISVDDFINAVKDETKRKDSFSLLSQRGFHFLLMTLTIYKLPEMKPDAFSLYK